MLENKDSLNYYETIWLELHGTDPNSPFLSRQKYVEACAAKGYEKAIDDALSVLNGRHIMLAQSYFGTGLSYLEVARMHGTTKGEVNYAVRAARRAISENELAICVGPDLAEQAAARTLPLSLLSLSRESYVALKSYGIESVRDLLALDPEELDRIPRISFVRKGEIKTAVSSFLSADRKFDVNVSSAWKVFLSIAS